MINNMTGPKRTEGQHVADLALTAELYLRGYSIYDITQRINLRYEETGVDLSLSPSMIKYDIELITKRWLNSAALSFTQARAQEVARLANLEVAYWEGWERSRQDSKEIENEKSSDVVVMQGGHAIPVDRTKRKRTVKQRDGGIQFLDGVMKCIETRCKIFGLFSPQRLWVDWRTEAVQGGYAADESEANRQMEEMVALFQQKMEKQDQEDTDE